MKKEITCETCNEVMGSIVKPIVTENDITLYRQMVQCSQGHHSALLVATPDDEGLHDESVDSP